MPYALFPQPKKATFRKESLDLTNGAWIKVDPEVSARLKKHAVAFARNAARLFPKPPQVTSGEPAAGQVLLTLKLEDGGLLPQGYALSADESGITLGAADEAGLYYGLQTLAQLLQETGARPPAFRIADEPDFPSRGVMLDVSRCKVPKLDTLFRIVEMMGRLKLNQLQLYTEHTFAFSEHEVVWHDASPLTPQDMLLLEAHCMEHYVELVPNLNSFGHFERWLRHPEYRHLAECPDGFEYSWGGGSRYGSVLRPSRNSLRFLDSLYREFLPNFTSDLFNVGCDETWELGKGWSKNKCEEKGTTRVYLDFLLGIHRLVRKQGRRMMFWGDIILHQPDLIREIPEDVVALEWGYSADHAFSKRCRLFKDAGATFYVCPGTSSWNSLTGRTPNALGNLANAARNGAKHGAIGYLITDWGDRGHHQYLPISYPGFCAGAAYSWCFKANAEPDVAAAIDTLIVPDAAGKLGQILMELGQVYELVPKKVGNGTIFNHLLFSDIGTKRLLEDVTTASLKKCVRRFDQLADRVAEVRLRAEDGELVKAELRNAIAMARLGAERGLAGLDSKYRDDEALRHALQHVISRHEQLWLARNRPGGLNESSGRLRRQLNAPE